MEEIEVVVAQLHALVVTAPDALRTELRRSSLAQLVPRAAVFRAGRNPDGWKRVKPIHFASDAAGFGAEDQSAGASPTEGIRGPGTR